MGVATNPILTWPCMQRGERNIFVFVLFAVLPRVLLAHLRSTKCAQHCMLLQQQCLVTGPPLKNQKGIWLLWKGPRREAPLLALRGLIAANGNVLLREAVLRVRLPP